MASFQCPNACSLYQNSVRTCRFGSTKFVMRNFVVKCEATYNNVSSCENKPRILIAGGGIGGLVLALAAKNKGYDVKVFEKDLSAARGEGRDRGPIQLSSSALSVLQAIDQNAANQIMEAGCVIGDRTYGFADGISGEWFTKFDLLTPALERSLPLNRIICRMELQDILVHAIGFDILNTESKVVDFIDNYGKVTVILENGLQYDGDILVGADGIWSEVRKKLFGKQEATYSGYTSYNGITSFVPPYIDTIGLRVFIGTNKYFVETGIGNGKMQWYAFHKEPRTRNDALGSKSISCGASKKKRLLELFGHWCDEVTTLISKTDEDVILRRDIYDRDMIDPWGIGRVTLLGDAAHPMQPNLGQGGCMAIEDCQQLILELNKVVVERRPDEIVSALRSYEKKRQFRVCTVHSASRVASRMLSLYQPYLELGCGSLSYLATIRIGTAAVSVARPFLQFFLSMLMTWVMVNPLPVMAKEWESDKLLNS